MVINRTDSLSTVNLFPLYRNDIIQRHIVYKTMFYYCFRLHNSWHRYTTRFPLLHVSAWCGHLQVHWVSQSPISISATLPTLASVYTLGVLCMYGFYVIHVITSNWKRDHSNETLMQVVFTYLRIYGLFNDIVNSSDSVSPDGWMILNNKFERMWKKATVA
jgi:hypothetical protein